MGFSLVCLFLLFLPALVASQGLTIESTFVNTYLAPSQTPGIINQTTTWQQNTATFVCTDSNYYDNQLQIQSPNGTITYWAIDCNQPLHSHDVDFVGNVPQQGTLYTTQACSINSLSAYNGQNISNFNPDSADFTPGARRLLGFGFGSLGTQFITGGACALTFGAISYLGTNCNAGTGNLPTTQWINQLNALTNFTTQQTKWDSDVDSTLGAQKSINSQVQTILGQLATQTEALANYTFTLNDTVYALAQHEDNQAILINNQFQTVYAGIALAGQQIIQTEENVQELQTYTFNTFQAIINITNTIQSNSKATNLANNVKFSTLTQLVKQLGVAVSQSFLLTQVKSAITTGIWQQYNTAVSNGEVFYVDPTQPGVQPATNFPDSLLQVVWDIEYLNYVAFTANLVHQYGWTIYCNADRYQTLGYPAVDYADIPTLIGPQNCTTKRGGPLNNCLCWIQISHKQCARPSGFYWQQINSNKRSDYTMVGGGPMCSGAVASGPNDGAILSTAAQWYSILGTLCQTQLAASPANRYQFLSYRLGYFPALPATPPSWYAPVCSMDLVNIFTTSQFSGSIIFTIITAVTQAYATMATDANAILQYQQGLQPSFITYTYLPFETLPDNNTYSCYRASIMGVSMKTQPVFIVNPSVGNPITTTVTATAYDSPPTNCIVTSCDFGNVVSFQSSSNVVYTNPLENLLPQADSVIFGVITPLGSPDAPPTTTVYNAPFLASATSGPLQSASGQLTYLLQPVPPGFVLADVDLFLSNPWPATALLNTAGAAQYNSRISSQYFNHEDAAYTIDQTLVTINNLQQCVVPNGQTPQWLCELLANYNVNPLTNFLQGKFVVSPDTWQYVVTLNINMGEIVQRVYPGCPDLSFQQYGPSQISFILTNSLPNPITIVVRLASTSMLCQNAGDKTYTLQPKQVFTRTFPTCGSQTIQIFQISSVLGLQSCGAAIPFVVNATDQTILQGPTAVFNQTFVQQQYITQTTGVILGAVNLMSTVIPFLTDATLNLTQQQRYAAINASFIAFINLALRLSTEQLLGNVSAVDIYNQYAPQLAAYAAVYQSTSLAVQGSLTKLSTDNTVFNARLTQQDTQFVVVNASLQTLVAANNALIAAINDINNANAGGYTCAGCPDIPLIYQLCCAVDDFGQFLANILLYGLIAGVVIALAYVIYRVVKNVQAKQKEDALRNERDTDNQNRYEDQKTTQELIRGGPVPSTASRLEQSPGGLELSGKMRSTRAPAVHHYFKLKPDDLA